MTNTNKTVTRFAVEFYSKVHGTWVTECYSNSLESARACARDLFYSRKRVRTLHLTPMLAYQMGLA